jgi:hypothetical protein
MLAIATTATVIVAPFDQFADLVTGRQGRPFHLSIKSVLEYDFGFVWYPVLGVFIGFSVVLPTLSRRANMGRVRMIVALIPSCIVLSVTLCSLISLFFAINYPGSMEMPNALAYPLYALLPALLLLMPLLAMYAARWMKLPRLALSIAATICLLGWFGGISSIAAIVTDYGLLPKISLVLSLLSLAWGAYTLTAIDSCAILDIQRHHGRQSLKESAINVGAYLSSARNLSILLLVFLFACINVSFSYFSRVEDLQGARRALAFGLAVDDLKSRADSMDVGEAKMLSATWQSARSEERFNLVVGQHALEGIGTMTVSLTLYRAYLRGFVDWVGVSDVNVDVVGRANWRANESLAGTIGLSGPEERQSQGEKSVQELLRATAQTAIRPRTELQDIAFRWQVDAVADAPDLIYRRVEREFVTREVNLPSVGLDVSSSTAMWWLAFGTLVLLIMVRSQIGFVGRVYPSGQSEPWLVLDLSKGLERVLANLWLLAILFAPWLVGGLLMMTVNAQIIADGISVPLVPALARVVGLVAIPLVGGWVAASLVARLLMLRREHYALSIENANPSDPTG